MEELKDGVVSDEQVVTAPRSGQMRPRRRLLLLMILLASTATTVFTAGVVLGQNRQVVAGEVLVPAGPARVGRVIVGACGFAGATTEWAARKHLGVRFEVDPETWSRPFILEPRTPADLDLNFSRGSQQWNFDARGLEQEQGVVPDGATHAFVCLVAGGPTSFVYVGG